MAFSMVSDRQKMNGFDWYVIQEKQVEQFASLGVNRQKTTILKDDVINEKKAEGLFGEYLVEVLEYVESVSHPSSVLFSGFVDDSGQSLFDIEKEVLKQASETYGFNIILLDESIKNHLYNLILNELGDNLNSFRNELSEIATKDLDFSDFSINEYASAKTLELLKSAKPNDPGLSNWNTNEIFMILDDIKGIFTFIENTAKETRLLPTPTTQEDLLWELGTDRYAKSKWLNNPSMEAISLVRFIVSKNPTVDEYDKIVNHWLYYKHPEIYIGRILLQAMEQESTYHNVWDDDLVDRLNNLLFDYQIYNKTGSGAWRGLEEIISKKLYELKDKRNMSNQDICAVLDCSPKELNDLLFGEELQDKKRYSEIIQAYYDNFGIDKNDMEYEKDSSEEATFNA